MGDVGKGEIDRVMRAYRQGSRSTAEVSAVTGLSVKVCGAYTNQLVKVGRLRRGGAVPGQVGGLGRGRLFLWYEPV